eukprot:1193887-Prorocentrum_minimum.AAC.2
MQVYAGLCGFMRVYAAYEGFRVLGFGGQMVRDRVSGISGLDDGIRRVQLATLRADLALTWRGLIGQVRVGPAV